MSKTRLVFLSITATLCAKGWDGAAGVVLDPDGRPVQAARVECAGRTAATAVDGRFSFPGVERCTAAVSSPGFETARVEIAAGAETRIELCIASLAEVVVVSALRRETTVEEAAVSATVMTRADLAERQSPLLGDVLREVPGVQVTRYGGPGSLTQVFARGGERTSTLVLIDGVPANDPGGEVNLAGLSTDGLDRIEVVRGPESALFGAEAASGVIQLFTARGNPEDRLPRGSLAYERGSFQSDRWRATLGGGSGSRFDYALAASQFHTVGEYQNDSFRDTTGTANAGYRFSDATQLRGVFRTFDTAAGVPNQVGYGIYDRNASEATRDTLASVRLDDIRGRSYVQRFSFGYHRSHDLFLDPQADGPYNVAALVRDTATPVPRTYFEGLAAPGATPPPGLRLVEQSVLLYPSDPYLSLSSRKDFEYQGTLTQGAGAAIFGYAYERQDANVTGNEVGRDNHALFLHGQRTVAGRLYLSGGLRLERNSAFGAKLTPRAGAGLRLPGSAYLRFSAGVGITDPSLLENYAQNPYYVGNPHLRPERTTSYEAGVSREWLGRRIHTEVSAFANSFRDLIAFVFLPYPEPSTWRNIDAGRARGLEFSARVRAARYLSLSGSYTRMWTQITRSATPDSPFTGIGQELPKRPGNAGAASLSIAPRRWTLQAGGVFVGERQDSDPVLGVNRSRGYQNLYAAWTLRLTRNVSPYARVENLLNSRYQEVPGYPALSRAAYGGLRLEW